jgi:hypothetical protein
MSLRIRSVVLTAASAALFAGTLTACGGGPPLPSYALPTTDAVKGLTFYLEQPKPGDKIIASAEDVIQSALIRAEYKITTDEKDPHDGVLVLDVSANEKQGGFMTVQVNGQTQHDYDIHVNLSVKDGGSIVDQKAYDYVASSGSSELGNGLSLVNDLTTSPRFRNWAKDRFAKNSPPSGKGTIAATARASASASAPPVATVTAPPTSTAPLPPASALGTNPGAAGSSNAASGAAGAEKIPPPKGSSGPKPVGSTAPGSQTAPKE